MPAHVNNTEYMLRDEIEMIIKTKQAIKDFGKNLVGHVQNLLDYLIQTKRDKPFKQNYEMITNSSIFK